MSLYDGVGFSYSLRAADATDIPPEEADILDARDRQLTDFTSTLKNQVVSAVSGIVPAPGDWIDTWVPQIWIGTTWVTTIKRYAYYCFSDRLAFVNCEITFDDTTSFPGNQALRFYLPVTARYATRFVGQAMFARTVGATTQFIALQGFLPGTSDTDEVRFITDRGLPWFGQTLTGNPSLSGNLNNSNFYCNFVFYPLI